MALALYRKYRPGTLADLVGQSHVGEPLGRALSTGRVHHAYLFSGPRGCGKTSTARILARSLNCESGPTAAPCGQCRSCLELAPNGPGSVDVVEMDAATHRGIDDARDLRERAIYAPAYSRYRVYIIDEAHQLTNEAANALLKVVEEPPAHLRFVFATTEPDKIIPTIRSRTFHYGFRLVPTRVLAEHLAMVCRSEGVPAETAALAVVAKAGGGSVRDSLSVLGQLLAGAGTEGLTLDAATQTLGLTQDKVLEDFVSALGDRSAAQMFAVVERVIDSGHDPRRFASDALERLRDLMILSVSPEAAGSGLVDLPPDDMEDLVSQAESLGLEQLSRAADLLSAGLTELRGASAPRLQLELLCARLALPVAASDQASLAARVAALERADHVSRASAGNAGSVPADSSPGGASARRSDPGSPARVVVASVPGGSGTIPPVLGTPQEQPPGAPGGRQEETAPSGQASTVEPASGALAGSDAEAGAPGGAAADTSGDRTAPSEGRDGAGASRVRARPAAANVPQPPRLSGGTQPSGTQPSGAQPSGTRYPVTEHSDPRSSSPRTPVPRTPVPRTPLGDTAGPSSAPPGAPVAAGPAPGSAAAVTDTETLRVVKDQWERILSALATRTARTLFQTAVPLSVDATTLSISVSGTGHVPAILNNGHDERLRQAILDVLGLDLRIAVIAAGGPGPSGSGSGMGKPGAGRSSDDKTGSRNPAPRAQPGPSRAQMVRAAAAATSANEEADEPSPDDPDVPNAGDGMALLSRQLGAKPIGEIDHS